MSDLLDKLQNWHSAEIFKWKLPEYPKLHSIAENVKQELGKVAPRKPDEYSLEETYEILKSVSRADHSISTLPTKHIRRAPWVLFQKREADSQPLATNRDLLNSYLSRVRKKKSSSNVSTLAYCFLYFYPYQYDFFEDIRKAIKDLVAKAQTPRLYRIHYCDEQIGILQHNGPKLLANKILATEQNADKILSEFCLSGTLNTQGFAFYSFFYGISIINKKLINQSCNLKQLNQLLNWAITKEDSKNSLRYPRLRIKLADGLLQPFNKDTPTSDLQQNIKKFLLEYYGDPRISSAMWQGVDQAALKVMYRWLVKATLEDFFRFLDHVASFDREADRHWTYRRAFWTAYLEAGMIEEAWVAFGPKAWQEAKRRLKDLVHYYAELRPGNNVKSNHAVLLLRVGGLVITEWSHVGKFRVWNADNDQVPRFYKPNYQRKELVLNPDFEASHQASDYGRWQYKLSTFIRKQSGFSIRMKDLMPK